MSEALMAHVQRIYCPLDSSISAAVAVDHAAALARSLGVELVLTRPAGGEVAPPPPTYVQSKLAKKAWLALVEHEQTAAEGRLRDILAELDRTGVVADSVTQPRPGGRGLLELLGREKAGALVVLGARAGQPGLDAAIFRFAHHARCSTLIVRGPYRRPFQDILVGTDFSAAADHALDLVLEIAPPESTLEVAHAWRTWSSLGGPILDGMPASELPIELERAANELGAAVVERCRERGRPVQFVALRGEAGEQLVAHSAGFDLVAIGSRGRSDLGEALFGRVADEVLRSAQCAVLVAEPPASG